MIQKAEAIVLYALDYRDESKIITFYTKEYGKLSGIAKGVKRPGSKMNALFEVGYCLNLVLYKKSARDLHLISEASLANPFLGITSRLDSMQASFQILDIMRHGIEESEQNLKLYQLLKSVLSALATSQRHATLFTLYFQLHFMRVMGFAPNLKTTVYSKIALTDIERNDALKKRLYWISTMGGFETAEPLSALGVRGEKVNPLTLGWVLRLLTVRVEAIEELPLPNQAAEDIMRLWDSYLKEHLGKIPGAGVRRVFQQMDNAK